MITLFSKTLNDKMNIYKLEGKIKGWITKSFYVYLEITTCWLNPKIERGWCALPNWKRRHRFYRRREVVRWLDFPISPVFHGCNNLCKTAFVRCPDGWVSQFSNRSAQNTWAEDCKAQGQYKNGLRRSSCAAGGQQSRILCTVRAKTPGCERPDFTNALV